MTTDSPIRNARLSRKVHDAAMREKLRQVVAVQGDRWAEARSRGSAALDPVALNPYERLREGLAEYGVVLVDAGTLERLAPRIEERKGPGWLNAALEAKSYEQPVAQEHIKRVASAVTTVSMHRPA